MHPQPMTDEHHTGEVVDRVHLDILADGRVRATYPYSDTGEALDALQRITRSDVPGGEIILRRGTTQLVHMVCDGPWRFVRPTRG